MSRFLEITPERILTVYRGTGSPAGALEEIMEMAHGPLPLVRGADLLSETQKLERIISGLDLSRFPMEMKIRVVRGPRTPIVLVDWKPTFQRADSALEYMTLTATLPFPGHLLHLWPVPRVVEAVVQFAAGVVVHELREAATYFGRLAFDPHAIGDGGVNPSWVWTGDEA